MTETTTTDSVTWAAGSSYQMVTPSGTHRCFTQLFNHGIASGSILTIMGPDIYEMIAVERKDLSVRLCCIDTDH